MINITAGCGFYVNLLSFSLPSRVTDRDPFLPTFVYRRGIKIDGNEIKLVIFPDDMTTFDTVSFSHLINTVEQFTSYSGLKMNHEKTEVMPLGNMTLEPTEVGVNEISSIVKILGVHFTYNHQRFCEKILNLSRNL